MRSNGIPRMQNKTEWRATGKSARERKIEVAAPVPVNTLQNWPIRSGCDEVCTSALEAVVATVDAPEDDASQSVLEDMMVSNFPVNAVRMKGNAMR